MKILKYEEGEKILRLALRGIGDGVLVHAVDEKGDRILTGNLLKIKNDGRIERLSSVNESLGFQLDEKGRIKEEVVEE